MVERSVYSLLDFTWLKDLCIVYWTHGRSVYSLLDITCLKDGCVSLLDIWLKDVCIVYWTSHG